MKKRKSNGNTTIEFPIVVFIFLLLILFPLIDMATLFLGSSAVASAARVAAVDAARAQTFLNDVSPTELSATNLAKSVAAGHSKGNVSIDKADVTVSAVKIPRAGGPAQDFAPSSQMEIDQKAYMYQIKVTIKGKVAPLVTLSKNLFGNIQGVTGPLIINTSSTATIENPDCLNG